jgi:hypothetical protein
MVSKKKQWSFLTSLVVLFLIGLAVYKLNADKPIIPQKILAEFTEELRAKGFDVASISYLPENNEINIQITEDDENSEKDIKLYVKTELEKNKLDDVLVSVGTFDFEKSYIHSKWLSASSEIDERLKKESDEYAGIAVDFHPKPVKYILKSSYSKSNYDGADLEHWVQLTNNVIKSKNLPELLKEGEAYEIRVRGKDKKVLESKSFEIQARVKEITIKYWNKMKEDQVQDQALIHSFVNASNTSKILNEVVKTEPLLRYEYTNGDKMVKTYHLWLSQDNKGYIQSLLPAEDTYTYKLNGASAEALKVTLQEMNENLELPVKIEFE